MVKWTKYPLRTDRSLPSRGRRPSGRFRGQTLPNVWTTTPRRVCQRGISVGMLVLDERDFRARTARRAALSRACEKHVRAGGVLAAILATGPSDFDSAVIPGREASLVVRAASRHHLRPLPTGSGGPGLPAGEIGAPGETAAGGHRGATPVDAMAVQSAPPCVWKCP